MRLLYIVNRPAWAVGTLARLFKLGAPQDWRVEIASIVELQENPVRFRARLADADVVHWMLHKLYAGARAEIKGGKHVVTVHHLDADESDLSYLIGVDAVVVDAEKYRDEVERLLRDAPPIYCVNLPVDAAFFKQTGPYKAGEDRGKAVKRIGFFAAATYESNRKGIDLLPAFAELMDSAGQPWEIVCTGLGWENWKRTPGYEKVPISHRVVPSYFDMPALYPELDAYLCMSRIEGGPMPVFEAIAAGVPVAATRVGRIPELLQNDMYEPIEQQNAHGAFCAINRLLEGGSKIEDRCMRARKAILAPLSVTRYQKRLVKLYCEVVGAPTPETWGCRPQLRRALMRRRWRAQDRTYWAKELWTMGRRRDGLKFAVEAALLDPFSAGIWRTVTRRFRGIGSRGCIGVGPW